MMFFKKHEAFSGILAALIIFAIIFGGLYAVAQTPGPARSNPSILYKSDGTEVGYLTTVAHDAGAAAVNPLLTGCYASAAAPSDVSADNDAVREWCLRNGARAIQPTFAGVLWSTGNGVAGTGTPRVTIASDNTAFSVNANAGTNLNTSALLTTSAHDAAFGTAGSADSQVRTIQGVASMTPVMISGANATAKINCTNNAFLNMTTATTTEIVALSGSTIIYVCSFSIVSNGGTATTVKFVDGTGSNCATSQSDRTAGMPLTAATNTVGIARGSGEGMILKTSTAGDALCVTSSGAATIGVDISYAQF